MNWLNRAWAAGFAAVCLVAACLPASAHELWIDPETYSLPQSGSISAQVKIGDNFKGDILAYIPAAAAQVGIADADGKRPLQGFTGDVPFFTDQTLPKGLQVFYLHALSSRITYDTFEKFENFLKSKGLDWVIEEHRRRGLPDSGFVEAYVRCAKALVSVDEGRGTDVAIGMPLELIAETNPYIMDPTSPQTVIVRLEWNGKPQPGAEIQIFRKGADTATVTTDAQGRAEIPVDRPGAVLLNAVHMVEGFENPGDVWHSYWASLTFEVNAVH